MARLEIWLPVKPLHINQNFGDNIPCVEDTPNVPVSKRKIVNGDDNNTCPPNYVKLYPLLGYPLGHSGTDLMAGEQNCYAALEGTVIEMQTDPARGLGLGIQSNNKYDLDDHGTHHIKLRYWHLKSFNVKIGDIVKVGDLIGITDNTGFSSGDHLHFEGIPMDDPQGVPTVTFPNNSFYGAINLMPFCNLRFATDYQIAEKAIESASNIIMNPSLPPTAKAQLLQPLITLLNSIKSYFHF